MILRMSEPYVVIMAGGRGERFWPASRLKRPKQLLPIVGDTPMLTQTVERLSGLVPPERIFVITNQEQLAAVGEVCPALPKENLIGEPMGRDTAAAVGLALLLVRKKDPDAVFALLPADHVIHDSAGFKDTLRAAFTAASEQDILVTIGITATHPATGYGYIQVGETLMEAENQTVNSVVEFHEKPNREKAEAYLESGNFFWNAGMFVWSTHALEAALKSHAPGLYESLSALDADWDASGSIDSAMSIHYPKIDKISVDYAIMEKAKNVAVIESAFDWDDVGEWPAIARHESQDNSGNTLKGETVLRDAAGNIVVAQDKHVVSLMGVEDLIVVSTPDATLVCHKDQVDQLKSFVKEIGMMHPDLM